MRVLVAGVEFGIQADADTVNMASGFVPVHDPADRQQLTQ
jgi:hypothetical protein